MKTGRIIVLEITALIGFLILAGCSDAPAKRVIIVGIDGMDYKLTKQWMEGGELPNLQALAEEGGFSSLGTSIPPESPVAWSNFITGMNPGGHGIFDFLHRQWKAVGPLTVCDPVTETSEVSSDISLFGWTFPLAGGEQNNKRLGKAFWEVLESHDIPASIFKIPANFPPTPTDQRTISGMGTPDVAGGYGTYFVYTDDEQFTFSHKIPPKSLKVVNVFDDIIDTEIDGPQHPFKPHEDIVVSIPMRIYIDPENPMIKIVVGEEDSDPEEIVLKQGEWSPFVETNFDIIPVFLGVSGITRFYLKSVRPDFTLFMDPININPYEAKPDISTPPGWASELAERNGYFYTKGMPEDTKALEHGVLTYDEYEQQTRLIYEKRKKMLFDRLDRHDSGLLFHYFCSIDLDCHMFWRLMDKGHPGHNVEPGDAGFIDWLYQDIDGVIGEVRRKLRKDDTLIIMSDHGFAPYYRHVHLNSWLLENGYAVLKEGADRKTATGFSAVDWSKTKAYGLGFACIYLNVRGREPDGIVDPDDVKELTDEISGKLLKLVDPKNGKRVFKRVYKTREVYSGEAAEEAPEIIVGCRAEYRVSNDSALGGYPHSILEDNMDAWSGCHLMAAEEVPGILFANKRIRLKDPQLYDLTVAVLKEYGIEKLPEMVGQPIFEE